MYIYIYIYIYRERERERPRRCKVATRNVSKSGSLGCAYAHRKRYQAMHIYTRIYTNVFVYYVHACVFIYRERYAVAI